MNALLTSRAITLLSLLTLLSLPGCMAFSDSSAMRIEVEVYKGPLSLEPELQLGELYGYLLTAQSGLIQTADYITYVACIDAGPKSDCATDPKGKSPWKDSSDPRQREDYAYLIELQSQAKHLADTLTIPICTLDGKLGSDRCEPQLNQLSRFHALFPALRDLLPPQDPGRDWPNQLRKEMNQSFSSAAFPFPSQSGGKTAVTPTQINYSHGLMEANRAAAALQAAAFHHATASTAGQSLHHEVRIATTYFIVAMSEYGNQIHARADALLKQLGTNGRDRRELPLSTHLRESEPTDFLHLFNWLDAHDPRVVDYLSANFHPNTEERIKTIDRLYADHFWSKINTVYASGRGKTQMAFIKDETGNWNLKSFDNDPTELLDAYTKVTKAALEGAVKVTQDMASGGISTAGKTLANQLLAIADQTAPDKPQAVTAPAGTLSLTHLQNRLLSQLDKEALKKDLAQDDENLNAFNSADDKTKPDKRQALNKHREAVIKKWTEQIDDHSHIVDLLSTTVKNK